ncbi:MAG: four helix bundle protein [Chloroflexi bacterium]|nr:four helix bundle protein [Chloroflexota bacterium]
MLPSVSVSSSFTNEGAFARDFGLRDQIQRAAVSVMTNIAEGFDCDSQIEFARFLGYSRRSAVEMQSLLYAALDIGYINKTTFDTEYQQAEKTKAIIGGLKTSLKKCSVNT